MSQESSGKGEDNSNAELVKLKEEYKALEEKLVEAEQKAVIAKNELEKIIQKNPQQLEELANVIAILEEQKTETTLDTAPNPNSFDHRRLPLPLELNCQIFECLKLPIQKKFICGLGRGIYGIYREKVLTKSKRLRNPKENGWNSSNTNGLISINGLQASDNTENSSIVIAKKGFAISELARNEDNYSSTILYYFEVTHISEITTSDDFVYYVGLSDGNNHDGLSFGNYPNSICAGISDDGIDCYDCERKYIFKWPNGDNGVPKRIGPGNVAGCGLLLNPANELSIFFTFNGIVLGGKQMPISPSVNCLYPTIEMCHVSLEANFGNDPAKPFEYNI